MSEQQEIEQKLRQIEQLVSEVKRLIEAEDGSDVRPALALCQESVATVPDWP